MEPARVLFVCTGNICRSPIAEGILRARAAARGVPIEVASRGIALDGRPATDDAVAVALARGADLGSHRSAILDRLVVEQADLVLGMERQHVREAVVLVPSSLARAFTLKELVRRGAATGPRVAEATLSQWLARVGAGRRAADLVGDDTSDDVADPYRRPHAEYERCADEIAGLVDQLVEMAWPRVAQGAA